MSRDEQLNRLVSSLDPDLREDALRIFQREALRQADEILNGGRRVPVEQPQKNSRRPMDEEE